MITCGCLMWGVMTVAFSQCDSVMQGYIFWGETLQGSPSCMCIHHSM